MFNPKIFNKWKAIIIEQGTDEWLLLRNLGIGASEAAIIMGLGKFEDIDWLWQVKTGLIIPEKLDNEAVLNGIALEPKARQEFIKLTDEYVEPMCGMHRDYDFIKVSLDGISEDGGLILEIKCPFTFFTHWHNRNKIANYYYAQVQWQLMTTQADVCCFYSYTKSGGYMQEIYPDKLFMDELLKRAKIFWNYVECKIAPDPKQFLTYNDYYKSEILMKENKSTNLDIDKIYKNLTLNPLKNGT